MYKIIKNLAFGFVFQIENDTPYFCSQYEIFLNGKRHITDNRNVVSVFGLKPNTKYTVDIQFQNSNNISFETYTEKPSYVINIFDYNVIGDGVTDDTSSINMAIYTAPKDSVVYIPKGEYLVDQILLKSNVDIYLEQGAVIKQSYDRNKLSIIKAHQKSYDHSISHVNSSWEGNPLDTYASLIYGKGITSVAIYGDGVIDGNGDVGGFWNNPKQKSRAFRPKNIFITDSFFVDIIGITSRNSSSWNIHPHYSDNISFVDLKIESKAESPNTDGINPESCYNVDIRGCYFSVGDDCIAIKSGKYYMSQKHLKPTRLVNISNCYMEKGHGAVVIGSEISCGVKNINVSNCLLKNTDRGFRIKTCRGRGEHSVAENISFSNVVMESVTHCFTINMFYHCDPDGKSQYIQDKKPRPLNMTPTVKNITIDKVVATDIIGSCVFIYGLPENPVTGVIITNCNFYFANNREKYPKPAMMEDSPHIENIGVYMKNAKYIMKNNLYNGVDTDIKE